jgi:LPS sulfotransferase NodH
MLSTVVTIETAATPPPTRTCIVASTPWSGSRRVGDVLGRTGAMRQPVAWFDPLEVPRRGRQFGLSIQEPGWLARYLEAVRARATRAGTCSILLLWSHLRWAVQGGRCALPDRHDEPPRLDTEVLSWWFPEPTYLWLRSRDAGTQALRWYLDRHPEVTDALAAHGDRSGIDWQEVRWLESMTRRQDQGWSTFFRIHDLHPVTAFHEDIRRWTPAAVAEVLGGLGIPGTDAVGGPGGEDSLVERLADDLAEGYRKARPRLCTTVGVRAVHA